MKKTTVPQSSQERNRDIMIPWSLGIRAQYEKTTVPQSSQERNWDIMIPWSLGCFSFKEALPEVRI